MMDLTKIIKRINGKYYEYFEEDDITANIVKTMSVDLQGKDYTIGVKKEFIEGYPKREDIKWSFQKEYLLDALDLLEGDITIFLNNSKEAPIVLEDDVFQVRIAPRVLEKEEDDS